MNEASTPIIDSISNELLGEGFLAKLRDSIGRPHDYCASLIRTSIEEARWGLDLLSEYDIKGKKILEAGSGSGILSACLIKSGHSVTSIEPAADGFDFYQKLSGLIFHHLDILPKPLTVPLELLGSDQNGKFDFIFSMNVLEHVQSVGSALSKLNELLALHGRMVHLCPNYIIPYEPHFGIILIPLLPRMTGLFIRNRLKENPVWENLNFITFRDVIKAAKKNSCTVIFKKDILFRSLKRLESSPEFIERQKSLPIKFYNIINRLGLLEMTLKIPYQLQTPMVFEWKK